jgi:hypothetical protein
MGLFSRKPKVYWRSPRPTTMTDLKERRIFFLTFHAFAGLKTDLALCGLSVPKRGEEGPAIGTANYPYICRKCEQAAKTL